MQRKILVKKRVGCTFQRTIDHGNTRQYLHFANLNIMIGYCYLQTKLKLQIILTTPNAFVIIHYPKIQMLNKS
jgi:hypothetical protein